MADTVADVLVRLGVDTAGLRAGFQEARNQTARFASDLSNLLRVSLGGGGPVQIIGAATRAAGGLIPGPVGAIVRGIGGLFSAIGSFFSGLFTRGARNAAKQIRQVFEQVLNEFNVGSRTLGQAIQRLERERERAIERLSGKKGGREELRKLLPEFDRALNELRARQKAIFEQFDLSLELLRTGKAFRDVAADVRELIRQYRTYVDAGGDLARANEFLSRSLEQLRLDSAVELEEGEQRAIEDALQLNELLREREEILAEAAEQERSILTRGVLERRRTVAQEKAAELEALRRRRDERVAELDQNIRLLERKVDIEGRVFSLAQERIALETRLLELKEQEFEREASRLTALKQVLAGIVPGAGGQFTLTPVLQQTLNIGNLQVLLGPSAPPAPTRPVGFEIIEWLLRVLRVDRARLGLPF